MSIRAIPRKLLIAEAGPELRERIYRARHEVYALEIGQHPANEDGRLGDRLDAFNRYLAVSADDTLAGFVSITPPGEWGYSIDKYFRRDELPFPVDDGLFEIRLLTVMPGLREHLPWLLRTSPPTGCEGLIAAIYALSGARVADLCASPHQLEELRALTPPWVVGLPAQVAAVKALEDPGYYAARRKETHRMRGQLAIDLSALGWDVIPGSADFLLSHLPAPGPNARELVEACNRQGLFVRDAAAIWARRSASERCGSR